MKIKMKMNTYTGIDMAMDMNMDTMIVLICLDVAQ
jgi:hypothetical protein